MSGQVKAASAAREDRVARMPISSDGGVGMWSEETAELLDHIKGVEWLLERKGATSTQVKEWERWLEVLQQELDEQPDWIAWKKNEFGDEEEEG